jgi:hypothetical protein
MMLPILISVSLAPVSYFFCANAAVLAVARKIKAAEIAAAGRLITGMWNLPL